MGELIQHQDQPVSVQTESTTILQVIQRAAADPQCDIEKMERLMAMHERMQAKTAEQMFNAAMAAMQCDIPTVGEDAQNAHTKNNYATLDGINHVLKPIMQRHGFAITFKVDHQAAGISITGILMHSAGHREQTTLLLPIDTGPGRNAVQAVGSSTTYGKRYVMCALLNITTGDARDDDGAGSTGQDLRDAALDDLLQRVADAQTQDEVTKVWQSGVKVLRAARDNDGYEELKTAVAARGKALGAAQ
jgi:hypothetical protein